MSNLRPLDEVARDVLFYRPCQRCQQGFLYCRGREPGRRYCGDCAGPAAKERVQRAQKTYRDSTEGREQHRDEEADRRERRLVRVGDRRLEAKHGELQIVFAAAPYALAVEEICDAPSEDIELEWLIVVWPGLLAEAAGWLGARVECPWCGRKGTAVRVVGLDVWLAEDTS